MSTITYPSAGSWINSCLVSANSYKILSNEEETAASCLESGEAGIERLGGEHHYARVAASQDKQEAWMVLFEANAPEMHRLSQVLEEVQVHQLYQNGFFWPFDLTWDRAVKGYLIHPIDTVRFQPIRSFLGKVDAPRWQLSQSLFQRLDTLHTAGLSLGGFAREQVRVDTVSQQVCFWPSETCAQSRQETKGYRKGGYLCIPQTLTQKAADCGWPLDGQIRDLFSAAVLSFYLLFFTHPFVGSAYWSLMRESYKVQYQNYPDYIFDPEGNNHLGFLDFEQEILKQWNRTIPELRSLFDGLFLEVLHPDTAEHDPHAPHWNASRWAELLALDFQTNGAPEMQSKYPFEMIKNYQV
ncbi:MAG TPA: hypothetical protein H9868_07310 [Candidatus Flavonifractor merdipullorum]|uniref:Uncharacterized protein n=1 Tax=Candidatus Flavonifractor merdipullorum TaxID=2838590 RepID=A0A9D1UNJ4_9FIRM|nr:hypothetical protein [Candidatus Flavonifractor merdipullorum]